jgi:hypothetical protein
MIYACQCMSTPLLTIRKFGLLMFDKKMDEMNERAQLVPGKISRYQNIPPEMTEVMAQFVVMKSN